MSLTVQELNDVLPLVEAFHAYQAFQVADRTYNTTTSDLDSTIQQITTHSAHPSFQMWRFLSERDPKVCEHCISLDSDFYELDDKNDLASMYPYGEWQSDETFLPHVHPNCRCSIILEYNPDDEKAAPSMPTTIEDNQDFTDAYINLLQQTLQQWFLLEVLQAELLNQTKK